ncbi:MAG: hypothetical protein IIV80_00740, partial [Clostridia bacterium]|nr:hypothetical protein [Clostridia bacterium]
LRRSSALKAGDFRILDHGAHHIVYERVSADGAERLVVAVHRGNSPQDTLSLSLDLLGEVKGIRLAAGEANLGENELVLVGDSACVLE